MKDKQIEKLIKVEKVRQKKVTNLIPSENYVSADVLAALGSEFNNKYAEGYPRARYYGGNEVVDEVEKLCQARALKLFKLKPSEWAVNVQPLSGSPANLAVYTALVPQGGKIMGMALDHGGHLTHGYKVSATGKFWTPVPYMVDKTTEQLDYEEIKKIALREKPAIIVAGYTAYPKLIDWKKFREIADKVVHPEPGRRTLLMVDMSHIAGLVAGGAYPSPFPYADIVTTTTHKTLRGPRAAMIFSRVDVERHPPLAPSDPAKIGGVASRGEVKVVPISKLIDRAVFPGLQGGPHVNQIAAVAVALAEAAKPEFKKYSKQVVKNAKALAGELKKLGWRLVSGGLPGSKETGTDSHLILMDVSIPPANEESERRVWQLDGDLASKRLEQYGIIVNKNTIPFDTRPPSKPSGIRLGTPAETTRGKKEKDMIIIARRIDKILRDS